MKREIITTYISKFRHISLLNVFEKLIKKRFISNLNKFDILSKTIWVQRHTSTIDAIIALASNIFKSLNKGKSCMCLFLDLSKTFYGEASNAFANTL